MGKHLHKTIISLLLCAAVLVSNCPAMGLAVDSVCTGTVDCKATEHKAGCLGQNNIDSLIAQLPEVSAPMGTEYYFYNQLSDVEKVMYRKISEATWENPEIVISGLGGYTQEELNALASRACTALIADYPMYRLYWDRWTVQPKGFEHGIYTFSPYQAVDSSEYLIRKAKARINEIVAVVGMEGDTYSRLRDLLDLMCQEMDYDPYYPFMNSTRAFYDDSAIGCLVFDTAVCAGFSDTVKILCDELQIPCITVGNAGHAWNYVRMDDGKWYAVDASRDIPFDWGYYIVGSASSQYSNANYWLSDPYHARPGDFSFPTLSKDSYIYPGTYTVSYHDVTSSFIEPAPTFVYTINDDGESCTVVAYEGPQRGDLVIPEQIDGYTVSAIGDAAFYRCTGFTGDLIIPDTVTVIGSCAFQESTGLTGSLNFPNQLEVIREYAFLGSNAISGTLNFPDSLKEIGRCAFYECESLTGDIVLPEGISLGDEIFSYCTGLNGVLYLPDDMIWNGNITAGTNISAIHVNETNENYATYDGILFAKDMKTLLACPSGKTGDLVIPEGVETISRAACYHCEKLDGKLVLPNSLKTIEEFAFDSTGLTGDLVIPNSVTTIASYAFGGSKFNGKLSLPGNLVKIEEGVFFGCQFTGDLIIPDTVTYIGTYAFVGATFNGQLHMSEAIVYIGENAISGIFTNSLELKDREVTIKENAFAGAFFDYFSCNCGHEYIVEPNLNGTGYHCPYCLGYFVKKHEYISAITAPTCTKKGCTTHTCSDCGAIYVDSYVDELGHDMGSWSVSINPTCIANGLKRRDCSRCDYFETEVVTARGHDHKAIVTAPTCTKNGYTTYICACGDTYTDHTTTKLGHDMGQWTVTNDPTCTDDGTKRRDCSRCDYFETEVVTARGHDHKAIVTAPTCTKDGYTTYICTCGDTYTDHTTTRLGHDMGQWEEVKKPTEKETGLSERSCTRCGKTEQKVLDKLEPVPTEPPTEPTEPPTEPTEPPTKPTEPPTKPTEPPTEPTEPPAEPTEPSTEPTVSPTNPKKPPTEPNGCNLVVPILVGVASLLVIVSVVVIVRKKK